MGRQFKVGKTATSIERTKDGTLRVIYHNTCVVSFDGKRTVTLNTGGWRTQTTKTRMNQAAHQFGLGFQVMQKDFGWFVRIVGADGEWSKARVVPFDDYSVTFKVAA